MSNLNEGLQANDLDFLIMPIVSIDEYESKIDDRRAVVVGFYVTDENPAFELGSFIERGKTSILDTEVSPAPTEDGYYMVFVEIERNRKLPQAIMELIDSVSLLTNVDKWQFSPYHSEEDENYPLTLDELKQRVNCDPSSVEVKDDEDDDEDDEITEGIVNFIGGSLLEGFGIDGDMLTIKSGPIDLRYTIVKVGVGEPDVEISVPMIGEGNLQESSRLQSLLGNNYQVYQTNSGMLILNDGQFLLLDPLSI